MIFNVYTLPESLDFREGNPPLKNEINEVAPSSDNAYSRAWSRINSGGWEWDCWTEAETKQKAKKGQICAAANCFKYRGTSNKSFFQFPINDQERYVRYSFVVMLFWWSWSLLKPCSRKYARPLGTPPVRRCYIGAKRRFPSRKSSRSLLTPKAQIPGGNFC